MAISKFASNNFPIYQKSMVHLGFIRSPAPSSFEDYAISLSQDSWYWELMEFHEFCRVEKKNPFLESPFLESPGNVSGPELYLKIKIYKTLS